MLGSLPQEELNASILTSLYSHFLGMCARLPVPDWLHAFMDKSRLSDEGAEESSTKRACGSR
jgi:hypothetical protein